MKRVWKESPLRIHTASQKGHYWETEMCADLPAERRMNAFWNMTESSKLHFHVRPKWMATTSLTSNSCKASSSKCSAWHVMLASFWDPCYEKLSSYVSSLWYKLLADLQWTFAAISKHAAVALFLSLKGHLGLLIAFQKDSLHLNKTTNGKEHNHTLLSSWSSHWSYHFNNFIHQIRNTSCLCTYATLILCKDKCQSVSITNNL